MADEISLQNIPKTLDHQSTTRYQNQQTNQHRLHHLEISAPLWLPIWDKEHKPMAIICMWRPLSSRARGLAWVTIPLSPFSRSVCSGKAVATLVSLASVSFASVELTGDSDIVRSEVELCFRRIGKVCRFKPGRHANKRTAGRVARLYGKPNNAPDSTFGSFHVQKAGGAGPR